MTVAAIWHMVIPDGETECQQILKDAKALTCYAVPASFAFPGWDWPGRDWPCMAVQGMTWPWP